MKKIVTFLLVAVMLFSMNTAIYAASTETTISLSDGGITVDGKAISSSASSAVFKGADIVYYEAGKGSDYGEGTADDEHTSAEASAHTVVTITQPGTYRISGKLSQGQIAVDLGSDAKSDKSAVVTLILDSVDITCTVAPAVIFYNVYECGVVDAENASGTVDTSAAGANVIIADGSVNYVNGAYVARIYKEGTTSKLHKYDGAFYSKMSMNISAESKGTGELHIVAENEGLDSELHLTINGGNIWIDSQDDGVNTNEDYVSVTTINGGYLCINGGLGAEGDGIDSNGYLTINGGTIVSQANSIADGGIDADGDITINGGTVIALGGRNDAVSSDSKQAFMELSYASKKQAGDIIRIEDSSGKSLLTYNPSRAYQSLTFASDSLEFNKTYSVFAGGTVTGATETDGVYADDGTYSGGVQQQYTGNRQSGFGGGGFGGMNGGERPQNGEAPGDGERPQRGDGETRIPPDGMTAGGIGTPPDGTMPEGMQPGGGQMNGGTAETGTGSVDFLITTASRSFSGVSDWAEGTGKTSVTFSVNGGSGVVSVNAGETPVLTSVAAKTSAGSTAEISGSDVQLTITDVPSESFAENCMLSDGAAGFASILPTDEGHYRLTISVLSSNETYSGTTQLDFMIGDFPFVDVTEENNYYDAIKFVYNQGLMNGTGGNAFSPSESVSRAMAITVFGRLANAEEVESDKFADVAANSWYSPYVGWAASKDIVVGYDDGRYGPNDAMTRQQMCVVLYNYANTYGIRMESGAITYDDVSDVSDWASEAVNACATSGLLDGIVSGNTLKPTANLTRAELADIMYKFNEMINS